MKASPNSATAMPQNSALSQAMEHTLALAKEHHIADLDVLGVTSETLTLKAHGGKIERTSQASGQGLGIRVLGREGRTGLAFVERLDPQALAQGVQNALENSRLSEPSEVIMAEAPASLPPSGTLELHNPELDLLTPQDLARFLLEAESSALAHAPEVKAVPSLSISRQHQTFHLASTHGLNYQQKSNSVSAYCGTLVERQGQSKSGYDGWSSRHWDSLAGARLGKKAAENGVSMLGAKKIPSGSLPVILDPEVAEELFSMYLGAFSAEAAQQGQSRLKGRIGETLAGKTVSLLDDPHLKGGAGSCLVDAEGTPTARLSLIEDGVFRNFAYHIQSGRKEGKASTGHGGRSYQSGISTHLHNVLMPLGRQSLQELLAQPERGLWVKTLEGGAGCNPISGDISVGIQGFLVENGQVGQPFDSVTLAGNFFQLLQNLVERGDSYHPQLSSLRIPALLLEGLAISS